MLRNAATGAYDVYQETFLRVFRSLRVWGYCLIDSHIHFVVGPERERSLARVFGRTHSGYARCNNVARSICGHLWQARFCSCALDDTHTWQTPT